MTLMNEQYICNLLRNCCEKQFMFEGIFKSVKMGMIEVKPTL